MYLGVAPTVSQPLMGDRHQAHAQDTFTFVVLPTPHGGSAPRGLPLVAADQGALPTPHGGSARVRAVRGLSVVEDLPTPHGGSAHRPVTPLGVSSWSSQPLMGDRHRTADPGTKGRRSAPNPSWGIGTAHRRQERRLAGRLPTPHGGSARAHRRCHRRSASGLPTPHGGSALADGLAVAVVDGLLPTPHGGSALGRDRLHHGPAPDLPTPHGGSAPGGGRRTARRGRSPNPSWGIGTMV